ncbi:MAG: phosphoadenosine phosphosulfate reductase family protein [Clostridia bacterium]
MIDEFQLSFFEEDNKSVFDKSISRLQFAAEVCKNRGQDKLYVCYSGGKDSMVLADLCKKAKIQFELHYNITGIDPPELIYHMRETVPELIWHKYELSMWELIVKKKMPPTRICRYCCSELKEHGGENLLCATGVRWAESVKRRSRRPFEQIGSSAKYKMLFNDNDSDRRDFENCSMKKKLVTNAIIDWADEDIWYYIKHENLDYCKLYDEGNTRLGCIGCPMATTKNRESQFERYPKFKQLYINAFDKMLKVNSHLNYRWKSGQEVFDWWLYGNGNCDIVDGQIVMFDED